MPGKSLILYKPPRRARRTQEALKLKYKRAAPRPAVMKVAHVFDEATASAFDRFAAQSDLGQTVEVDVPAEKSEKPADVLSLLRKHGAAVTSKGSTDAVQAAIDEGPRRHLRHVAQTGWYGDGLDVFVRPTHVIGSTSAVEELLPPRARESGKRQVVFGNSGTIEGWCKGVADHARWSTRATLMIGAAFGGPLLRLLGRPSFGIFLFALPKTGKSTAQLAGATVVGLRSEEAMPSCEATVSGLYQVAGLFNDSFYPINEVGLLGRSAYSKLGPLFYALSGGKDRTRHDGSSFATDVTASSWSLIYAMSSEHSAETLAAQCGVTRGGDVWRCLDVPAVHDGHATIFDRRPGHLTDEAFNRLAYRRMAAIRRASQHDHGVVFDTYLRGLIDLGEELRPRAQAYVDEFVRALRLRDADGGVDHAAINFGVIYAGLRLAMDLKILRRPWRPLSARRAVESCFRDGLKAARSRDKTLEEAKAILHQGLQEADLPRKCDVSKVSIGFRTMEGPDEFVAIRSVELVRWFDTKPTHLTAILTWLDEQGALKKRNASQRPGLGKFGWAVTTPRCPGWKQRCFVFRLSALN